ncbi:unnamed protein product [Ceutorhynchus assimilis]|uniref:Acyl-CoA-binding domain-containing protein 6 n=1 Tax=Ceutorhynchus assimilis TaxID=467358 RepID=A0A9N9MUH2_9CUCU|nr:unnamed protein product [Ceutorhynchus assimilis]
MAAFEDDFSDLVELGIDVTEDDLQSKFDKCTRHLEEKHGCLDKQTLSTLYALFKQSTTGSKVPDPKWVNEECKALENLDIIDQRLAKNKYIEKVLTLFPQFSFDEAGSVKKSWARVSSMVPDPKPSNTNIQDYIRANDITKVKEFLINIPDINEQDEDGVCLVHYAADVGSIPMLEFLIKEGACVNAIDECGQTPLHYAASCGHKNVVQFLLGKCDPSIVNEDGFRPEEVATDDDIKEIILNFSSSK